MLNETNIKCFLSLCETLSFTESARKLYLSQQAVSKNIMQLESDLGFRLINRTARSVCLTEAGARVEKLFREQAEIFHTTITKIREDIDTKNHTMSVGFQDFLDFGPEIVDVRATMKEKYPNLYLRGFRHSPGELNQKLEDGSLDLIILYRRYVTVTKPCHIESLFETRVNVMVSVDNPLVSDDSTYLDFVNEPYVVDTFPGESDKAFTQRVEAEMQLCRLHPSAVIQVPNRESAYLTATLERGILLGSDISQITKGGQMLRFRTNAKTDICCVWLDNPDKQYVREYVDLLVNRYNDAPSL